MKSQKTRRLTNAVLVTLTVTILSAIIGYSAGFFRTDRTYVQTTFAERRTLTNVVEAFGRVHPSAWVTVRPEVSGEVVSLPAEEGSRVRKGDLLMQIRSDSYETQISEAHARVKKQRAILAQYRADSIQAHRRYNRQQQLYEKGVSFEKRVQEARHSLREATSRLRAAQAKLRKLQAGLEKLQQRREKTKIEAPVSGVVERLNVQTGERVVGTTLFPGTRMMRIAKPNKMGFRANVEGSNVVEVSTGDTASIQLNAHPDRMISARVSSIATTRQNSPEERTSSGIPGTLSRALYNLGAGYPIRLNIRSSLGEEAPSLRTGMGGTVRIRTSTVHDAVSLPREAITFRPGDRKANADSTVQKSDRDEHTVVFIVRNGTAERTYVEVGIRTEKYVQIQSGIQPSDEVIVGPEDAVQQRLTDGTAVKAIPRSPGS